MTPTISVILPTHNPAPARLDRTLRALGAQTLAAREWEIVLVDNASVPAVTPPPAPSNVRLVHEPQLGLTAARCRGFHSARAPLCVLVDDDNLLAPDYLATARDLFAQHPRIGAIGGISEPEFEVPPAPWQREFFDLLALRDLGDEPRVATGLRPPGAVRNEYPACAPIGAGMGIRREPALAWAATAAASPLSDRRGAALTSGGDNDIVFTLLAAGWHVGYFPQLRLTHLIPAARLTPGYLGRLNRGIQKSWMQVLRRHDANPWPPISAATVPLRQARAWFSHRAWSGPAAAVRWQGACGHFEGRVVTENL